MPSVFISYSSKDSEVAQQLHLALSLAGASPFLAELNLTPGKKWKDEILENLRQSQWVFFLATPNSCNSQAVAHEIGASLVLKKQFIPLMLGVTPSDLPDWVDDVQAIDMKDTSRISQLVQQIGETVKSDKFWTGVCVAALIGFALWALSRK